MASKKHEWRFFNTNEGKQLLLIYYIHYTSDEFDLMSLIKQQLSKFARILLIAAILPFYQVLQL